MVFLVSVTVYVCAHVEWGEEDYLHVMGKRWLRVIEKKKTHCRQKRCPQCVHLTSTISLLPHPGKEQR